MKRGCEARESPYGKTVPFAEGLTTSQGNVMRRLARNSAIFIATACVVTLGSSSAFAASSAWRPTNECALLSVGGRSITTVAGPTKVTADDGGAPGDVGLSVKTATTTSSAVFAGTSVTITGKGMTQYKVWH